MTELKNMIAAQAAADLEGDWSKLSFELKKHQASPHEPAAAKAYPSLGLLPDIAVYLSLLSAAVAAMIVIARGAGKKPAQDVLEREMRMKVTPPAKLTTAQADKIRTAVAKAALKEAA